MNQIFDIDLPKISPHGEKMSCMFSIFALPCLVLLKKYHLGESFFTSKHNKNQPLLLHRPPPPPSL